MSHNIVVNFTTDELKKLVEDEKSCVTVIKSVYSLQLYPYHLSDINASIKEILNSKVAKYDKKLGGILLGYKNLKLLNPIGSIIFDSCFIHIDIEGDFYIFTPELEASLKGIVSKRTENHIGCLVHRLFNVSVPNTEEENWAGKDVNIGDEVLLCIEYTDLEARLPYIRCQLVEITKSNKPKKVKDKSLKDETDSPKKKKKKLKINSDTQENTNEPDTVLKKSKKKVKDEKINNNDSNIDLNTNELLVSKKKKKSKDIENNLEIKKKRKSNKIKNNQDLNDEKESKEMNSEELTSLKVAEIINKPTKEKKKRKSIENKQVNDTKISVRTDTTCMADAEDRKPKKRKSITKNIDWDSKELNLYDSDLEKTLNESPKNKKDKSFHLVKISALNESNKLKRKAEEIETTVDKKRKRKNDNTDEGIPKKIKKDKSKEDEVTKKPKVKKKLT